MPIKLFYEALNNKTIKEFSKFENIKTEAVYDSHTLDLISYLKRHDRKVFLEVKNVTLSTKENVAEFPDASYIERNQAFNKIT